MGWTLLLFLLGFVLLYKGGDVFVDSAVNLARHFGISEVLIGATIVSIGTTIPETMVSALASASGTSDIAYGNALGSIICNTAFIAGLLLVLMPVTVKRKDIKLGMGFFFCAGIVFFQIAFLNGGVSRGAGIGLILIAVCYMLLNISGAKRAESERMQSAGVNDEPLPVTLLTLIFSAAILFAGSNLLINNGIILARQLKIPEQVIGLTFIALGTSLPELVTAITAISKGHGDVSLGNIIGANFLNLTVVIGLSSAINSIQIAKDQLITDCLIAGLVMLILTVPVFIKGHTRRRYGVLLLGIYILYCIYLFSGSIQANTVDVFAPYVINY